jgi:hypothetical protein
MVIPSASLGGGNANASFQYDAALCFNCFPAMRHKLTSMKRLARPSGHCAEQPQLDLADFSRPRSSE